MVGALYRFWYLRGHVAEGQRRLEHALSADERPTAARARALNGASTFALETGDAAMGKRRAEQAMALSSRIGDTFDAGVAGLLLGHAHADDGDFEGARSL